MKRGHYPRPSLRERFEEKYIPEPNSGCWLWLGALCNGGYGNIRNQGFIKSAHRISYEMYKGIIPEGLHLDHLCRVRCCVNPNHLEPVTRKENIRRGVLAGTFGKAERRKTHCPMGHSLSGKNLYLTPNGSRNCKECRKIQAREFRKRHKMVN